MDIVEFEMFDYCKSFKQFLFYAVDELPIIERELKRSLCRKQASEALATVMSLEVVEEVLKEASM
jgi:histone demethylase JARID1